MSISLNSFQGEPWPTLTVNSRLARWRLLQYNEAQHRAGRKAWPTPEILPLTAWLKQVWLQSWPEQYILTPLQSESLWAKIVRQNSLQIKLDLLHLRETSKRAAEAHSLIQQYHLPLDLEIFSRTEEGKLFLGWLQIYQKWLVSHNAIDPASVLDAVQIAMSKGRIPLPKGIVFAGFEEITPQFKKWLNFLETKEVQVRFEPDVPETNPPPLKSLREHRTIEIRKYNNKTDEAIQCSRWLRAHYRAGLKFGIVVPDMQTYRPLLNRELAAELAPQSIFPWVDKERPFNISLGTPLAEEPMINIALQLLSANKNSVPLRVFTSVIKSPFFASGQKEALQAHQLETKLIRKNTVTVYLKKVDKYFDSKDSEQLAELLHKWSSFNEKSGQQKLPGQWGEAFTTFLKSLSWPKTDNNLSLKEYQVYESWKECLDKLASLDTILGELTLRQAMETLTGIVQEHSFQIKTNESPIQAVGLLESSGMQFDYIWVMGCHSEALPTLPSPNPFLPVETRKQYNLPHSTAQRELEFAYNSVRRLIASTPKIIFSHPALDKNTELKISPLLLPFKETDQEPPTNITISDSESHRLKDQLFLNDSLQVLEETVTLPATSEERSTYTVTGPGGGYGMLKNQAECPFRSFSNHRLNTQTVDFPELDFDHRERGTIVHQALEFFWQETRFLNKLLSLASENTLQDKIECAVLKALKKQESQLAKQPQFYEMEKQRVVDLVHHWLNLEMKRTEFEVVNQEKEISLTISGITLSLRIDRIDRTDDGKILLIDYKTGDINPKDWFGDRIKEPQLPLYATQQSPSAILFGQVKKGSHQLKGAVDPAVADPELSAIDLKKITGCDDWDEQLNYWRNRLTSVADQFLAGQTEVDPLEGSATCKHCGLQTLCRVQEMQAVVFHEKED